MDTIVQVQVHQPPEHATQAGIVQATRYARKPVKTQAVL